jgi:hypothetical protein
MPKLLDGIYKLQSESADADPGAQQILKLCANLLESHYEVAEPRNRFTFEEYDALPGRWEMIDGMLMFR